MADDSMGFMNAYLYQGALWCEDCADDIRLKLTRPIESVRASDAERWPQRTPNGGGEANAPLHCANPNCRKFLENPLTDAGRDYLVQAFMNYFTDSLGDLERLSTWWAFYVTNGNDRRLLQELILDRFADTFGGEGS